MAVFVELVAVELAVTVSVGAVMAFVAGLLSAPNQSERPCPPRGCDRCGAVVGDAASIQHRPSVEHS
jgi:hypothetical protein